MKTYYFVDFENMHENAMIITQEAAPTDEILLFYTSNSPKIELKYLKDQKAKIDYFEIKSGKQSLDLSLCSYLGYLIKAYGNRSKYIILSGDTGFDNVIDFWKSRGIAGVTRQKTVEQKKAKTKENNTSENDKTVLNNKIAKALKGKGLNGNTIGDISSLVVKHYNEKNSKHVIYLEIIKKYGQKDGLEYYGFIKKEL